MGATRPLLEPIQIGGLEFKNRVMQVATRTNLHSGGELTDALLAFYRERAAGGVGAIVVEPLASPRTDPGQPSSFARSNLGKRDKAAIEDLRRLTSMAHDHGVRIIGQLFHGGRQHHASTLPLVVGPSEVACPYSGGVPHMMDLDEIRTTVAGYVDTAVAFAEAGFDGVEVHGAQGHLIQQFLSGFSNRRDDEYGGSPEKRMRFLRDILQGIRDACGPDLLVGLRLAAFERSPGGLELEDAIATSREALRFGVGYLSLSAGNFNSIEVHIPDRSFPEVPLAEHTATLKREVPEVPVVICGRILSPENGDTIIRSGQADIVGLSRPLICDPEWTGKAARADDLSIRYCISCNQCWAEITSGRPIRCVHNAAAGRELEWGKGSLEPAPRRKRVVVAGGGPAGMEAARVAAERGHDVVLFERARQLGGSVAHAATIPGHGDVGYVVDYLRDAMTAAGVDVRLGPAAELDRQKALDEIPDAVVIATGATHHTDMVGAPSDIPVLTSLDVVRDKVPLGERCMLLDEDGYYEACEVAEFIAGQGITLYIVTRFPEVGREVPRSSKISILRHLDTLGVELIPTAWLHHTEGRTVHLVHQYSGRQWAIEDIDTLVHVGGKRANDRLYHELKDVVPEVHRIGDAFMPRRIMDAVREGHTVGRQL